MFKQIKHFSNLSSALIFSNINDSEKLQNLSTNVSSANAILVTHTGDDVLTELPSRASKTSGTSAHITLSNCMHALFSLSREQHKFCALEVLKDHY